MVAGCRRHACIWRLHMARHGGMGAVAGLLGRRCAGERHWLLSTSILSTHKSSPRTLPLFGLQTTCHLSTPLLPLALVSPSPVALSLPASYAVVSGSHSPFPSLQQAYPPFVSTTDQAAHDISIPGGTRKPTTHKCRWKRRES